MRIGASTTRSRLLACAHNLQLQLHLRLTTIFRSFDDAKTWRAEAQTCLYTGLGGYSCLTTLPAAAAADENSEEEEGSLGIIT